MNNSVDNVLHNRQVIADEIRSMAAIADEVETALERIAARLVVSDFLENQMPSLADLKNIFSPTCDMCLHYRAHPSRCQFSKRSISPKQFHC